MLKDRTSLIEWLLAAILTVVVITLIVVRWHVPGGVWRDELACIQLSLMPTVSDIWKNFEHEAFPPTFPLLVRGYLALAGHSDVALHTFGLIVSLLFVASIWTTAWLVRSRPPLLSLGLLGLNSSVLIWISVVRGYGLASVLIPLFYGCLYRVVETPNRKWTLLSVLAGVLSVQCAIQNWLLVFAICLAGAIAALMSQRYRLALLVLTIGGIAGLAVVPYLPQYLSADWRHVVAGNMTTPDYLTAIFFNIGPPQRIVGGVWIFLLLSAVALAAISSIRFPEERTPLVFGIGVAVASLAVSILFFLYMSYSARAWHFIPLLTILACNLEMLLTRSFSRTSTEPNTELPEEPAQVRHSGHRPLFGATLYRWGRIAILVGFAVVTIQPTWHLVQNRLTNMDVIVGILEEEAHPDDLIVACPWYYGVSLRWYYHGPSRRLSVPILGDQPFHRYDLVLERMKAREPLEDLKEEIQETLRSGRNVWVVGHLLNIPETGPRHYAPAPDPVVKWSEDHYVGSWMEQMTWFFATHSRSQRLVEIPLNESVAVTENLRLWRFQGWK